MKAVMEEREKPRVLVAYVEAGMGHIVSAQAISEALKKNYSDSIEVIDRYILRDSDDPILKKYETYLVHNVQMCSKYPAFGDIQISSMHLFGAQNTLKFVHSTVFAAQIQATMREYEKFSPDAIVCTHYFLLHAAVKYKLQVDPKVVVIAYCPDNNVHGWWDNRADVIYTNNPLATKQAYELKFPNGHVREAFYPTRSEVVESNETKEYYRKKFGIPLDKFTVVVADGVYAKAKAKSVCKELMKSDMPLTICLLAGKNDALKAEFEERAKHTKPNITLLSFGFLKDAPQLYGACDLFITKAGPNAILDSVMMNTPLIIDYCASPIERATKKLFSKHYQCGYYTTRPRRIRKYVECFIQNPAELEKIRKPLAYFDKTKNGAGKIADDIADLLQNSDERMMRILHEEEIAVSKLFEQAKEKKEERARRKIEAIEASLAAKTENADGDAKKKLEEDAQRRISAVKERAAREIAKISKKQKKVAGKIYSGTASKYVAKTITDER